MGKTLSLTIVAEGVETAEQQLPLCERSCDEMQGFHFSPPIGAEDVAILLRENEPVKTNAASDAQPVRAPATPAG